MTDQYYAQAFKGKSVLVTGATSGIGFAAAEFFASQGAEVVVHGRDRQKVSEVCGRLNARPMIADIGIKEALQGAFESLKQEKINLDVVVINAATLDTGLFCDLSDSDIEQIINTNFTGSVLTLKYAIECLNPGAKVVVVTSICNKLAAPGLSLYSATKAALRSLVQTTALELLPQGIRVNAVSPGPIDTEGLYKMGAPEEVVDAAKQQFAQRSPSSRLGTPNDIVQAIAYLASDNSSYVVGEELVVDGGMSLLDAGTLAV